MLTAYRYYFKEKGFKIRMNADKAWSNTAEVAFKVIKVDVTVSVSVNQSDSYFQTNKWLDVPFLAHHCFVACSIGFSENLQKIYKMLT